MTRKRTSPIWTKNKSEMQKLLNDSSSFVEVLEKLGLCGHSGNHRTLKERIKLDSLDIESLKKKRKEKIKQVFSMKKTPLSKMMVKASSYSMSKSFKKRMIEENVLDYFCQECGNKGEWMGKKLSLQIEHKNGDSKDHRVENLCFLCPNCHSQTETYAGKNSSIKKSRICVECKGPTKGKGKKCVKCATQKQPQKFFITKDKLQELVKEHSMTFLGRKFGVTDNAVRKRCKKLGVEWPKPRSESKSG